jgi:kinesin family protein 2/24
VLAGRACQGKEYDVVTRTALGDLAVHEPKENFKGGKEITNSPFQFDRVYNERDHGGLIYTEMVRPLVWRLLRRGTGTVFAYGQTGSGKTFTMQPIYAAAVGDLFAALRAPEGGFAEMGLQIWVSCYEIYKAQVYDLLGKEGRSPVRVMEDAKGDVNVFGLTHLAAPSAQQALEWLKQAFANRVTSANATHNDSSRRCPYRSPASAAGRC